MEMPRIARGKQLYKLSPVTWAELSCDHFVFFKLRVPFQSFVPFSVEYEIVRPQQYLFEFQRRVSEGSLEELGRTTHDPVGGLQNDLHRTKLVARPLLADMSAIWAVGGLVAHGEGPNSHP